MRLPIGIVAGLFVYTIFLVTIMFLLDGVPLVPGLAALVGFFAIPLWLIRKPLPSDIVGDACYGIGLLLVSMPPAFVVHELVAILLGTSDGSPGETVLLGVFGLLAMAMPAALFFVVGCVGNRYARSKLDSKAEEATDPTNV